MLLKALASTLIGAVLGGAYAAWMASMKTG
jgi:hypothetical protein